MRGIQPLGRNHHERRFDVVGRLVEYHSLKYDLKRAMLRNPSDFIYSTHSADGGCPAHASVRRSVGCGMQSYLDFQLSSITAGKESVNPMPYVCLACVVGSTNSRTQLSERAIRCIKLWCNAISKYH